MNESDEARLNALANCDVLSLEDEDELVALVERREAEKRPPVQQSADRMAANQSTDEQSHRATAAKVGGSMKIQGEDLEVLRKVAEAGIERMKADGLTLDSYLKRDPRIPRIDKAKDVEKRYRWDCFYLGQRLNAGVRFPSAKDHEPGMGGDYNDSHIDTALKHVVDNYIARAQTADSHDLGQDDEIKRGVSR